MALRCARQEECESPKRQAPCPALGEHAIARRDADPKPLGDVLALHSLAGVSGGFGAGGRLAPSVLAFRLGLGNVLALVLKHDLPVETARQMTFNMSRPFGVAVSAGSGYALTDRRSFATTALWWPWTTASNE
jgi:hypothetical protein